MPNTTFPLNVDLRSKRVVMCGTNWPTYKGKSHNVTNKGIMRVVYRQWRKIAILSDTSYAAFLEIVNIAIDACVDAKKADKRQRITATDYARILVVINWVEKRILITATHGVAVR